MSQSKVCCKGFFYLAAFLVLTHYLIEPVIGVISEKEEQFINGAVYKNDFEPLTLHKRPSFFVGSRYGRSNGGSALSSSKTRRLSVVPRNDRFFLGSRYGKRSEENSAAEIYSPYEQENQLVNNEAINTLNGLALQHTSINKLPYGENNNMLEKQHHEQDQIQTPLLMSCVYTGLRNFFRCRNKLCSNLNTIVANSREILFWCHPLGSHEEFVCDNSVRDFLPFSFISFSQIIVRFIHKHENIFH